MYLIRFVRTLFEDFKAWRRGEHRVAPRSCRGRVYSDNREPKTAHSSKAATVLTVKRRVYRAATDTWEELPELRTETKRG